MQWLTQEYLKGRRLIPMGLKYYDAVRTTTPACLFAASIYSAFYLIVGFHRS